MLGDYDRGVEYLQRALQRRTSGRGADHPSLAPLLANLGEAETERGNLAAAQRHYERALEVMGEGGRADQVFSMTGLAKIALARGDMDAARREAERGHAIASDTGLSGSDLQRLDAVRALIAGASR